MAIFSEERGCLILEELKANMLAAAHKVQPGREVIVRKLRKSVWWPGMEQEAK